MLGWFSSPAMRASLRNISTKDWSLTSSGRSFFTTMVRFMPLGPEALARYSSAIPPVARRLTSSYLPSCSKEGRYSISSAAPDEVLPTAAVAGDLRGVGGLLHGQAGPVLHAVG